MREDITRRGFAVLPPAAVIAIALPLVAASGAERSDAELLTLASAFERLHEEWQALDVLADQSEPIFNALYTASRQTMADFKRCRIETGYEEAIEAAGDKLEEIDVVAARMRALPAQTLQGLAVKARLLQFDVSLSAAAAMEGPERNWDWDARCMMQFVREIRRFAEKAVSQ